MSEPTSRRPAYSRLLDRAVRILAVRDHSEQELRRKLSAPVMSKTVRKTLMPPRKIMTAWLPGATSITIWMTAVLPLAFLPAVVVKAMGQRVSAELNQKGVARESIEKPCAKVKLTGANWRVSRRYESTVSRCRVNFQKS